MGMARPQESNVATSRRQPVDLMNAFRFATTAVTGVAALPSRYRIRPGAWLNLKQVDGMGIGG